MICLAVVGIATLSACGGKEAVPAEAQARPAKIMVMTQQDNRPPVSFPAVIRARESVELAFNVPGQVVELDVIEGRKVAQGTILARLDAADFSSRLEAAQSALELAQSDFDRFSELAASGAVAAADLDRRRAALQNARSELEIVRKSMEDTVLRAPFEGVVAQRLIQRFANVQAKQPVLIYQSLSPLDVVIDVPEPLVLQAARNDNRSPQAAVRFNQLPGVELPVSLREINTEADPVIGTYRVVFALDDTAGLTILPGMSATLVAQRSQSAENDVFILPPLAVAREPGKPPFVWLVDAQTGAVSAREVSMGTIASTGIEIVSGLQSGEQVVVAGISQLREGMKVRPLQQ
jgi:RND family efflux transporter MFP subunit